MECQSGLRRGRETQREIPGEKRAGAQHSTEHGTESRKKAPHARISHAPISLQPPALPSPSRAELPAVFSVHVTLLSGKQLSADLTTKTRRRRRERTTKTRPRLPLEQTATAHYYRPTRRRKTRKERGRGAGLLREGDHPPGELLERLPPRRPARARGLPRRARFP